MASKLLRQSTAFTYRAGPFVDSADATAETGLSIAQADIQLSKDGGAFAQTSAASPTTTHDMDGYYQCPLTTTDTNTLGPLKINIAMAGCAPYWDEWMVVPANVYDALVDGADLLDINVSQFGGSNGTFASGRPEVNASHIGGTSQTGNDIGADVDLILADTADMQPKIGTPAGASIAADIAAIAAKFSGITLLRHWLGAIMGKQTADSTALTEINASGAGSGTYNPVDDSLEALKDGAATVADVETAVQGVIEDNHLDHLLAVTYDPASKPGAADALLNELVESDAGVARFTANALEQAPSGGGGSGDWTTGEKEQIRHRLGIDGTASAPSATPSLATAAALATVDGIVDDILIDTGTTLPATLSSMDAKLDTIDNYLDTEIAAIISSLATITGLIDTEIAAILADTNELQTDWADGGRLDSLLDAIKAITDALPNAGALTSLAQDSTVAKEATLTSTGRADPAALSGAIGSISLAAKVDWIFARVMREGTFNKTTGEEYIKNAAGTNIAKATAADDSTTTTRGAFGAP